jgi:integrase
MGPHTLRHTAATLMLTQGIHPKIVSERLGHSTVSLTLDTYSHAIPDLQQDAAEAIDLLLEKVAGGTVVTKMLPADGR